MKVYIVTHQNGSETIRVTHPSARASRGQAPLLARLQVRTADISARSLAALRKGNSS
jgi:hypothetical protein